MAIGDRKNSFENKNKFYKNKIICKYVDKV